MGLFNRKKIPKVEDRTAGSSFSFYLGNSAAGKMVTERSALQTTAVYACVRILSEAVAGLPLHLYRYKDDGSKEKAIDTTLYRLLHDEPNPEMSSFVFRETLILWDLQGDFEIIISIYIIPIDKLKNNYYYITR